MLIPKKNVILHSLTERGLFRMDNRILKIIFVLTVLVVSVKAEEKRLFTKISLEQGLSQSTVLDIAQDSLGYMWFATRDGLNRFNGYEFNIYKSDPTDTLSISSDVIYSLCVDDNNRIWAGGENGVSYYSYDTGTFKNYVLFNSTDQNSIRGIVADGTDIWLGSSFGSIYLLDRESDIFHKIAYKLSGKPLKSIAKISDDGDFIHVCSREGLFRFDKRSFVMNPVLINGKLLSVHDVVRDSKGGVWVATDEFGIFYLDKNDRVRKHFHKQSGENLSLLNNKIRALSIDNAGDVWIGTFKGLSILNTKTSSIENYTEERGNPFSLSQNSVRAVFVDRENGVWVGTYYGGISYYRKGNVKFHTVNMNGGEVKLNDNVVNSIKEGPDGSIWIGTNDHGLNRWDRKNNKMIYYSNIQKKGLNNIKNILLLKDGTLLIGEHWGGVCHFNPVTGNIKVFKKSEDSYTITDNRVDALLMTRKGEIWVGSYNGLFRFELESGKFIPFHKDVRGNKLSSRSILTLLEDAYQRIWIGTFNGLNVYHRDSGLIETFLYSADDSTSLSRNEITCIFEDSKKHIWVGTSKGLNLFDEVTRSFKRFTTKDGLSNDFICALLEDERGNLWISTNKGLNKLNMESGRCQRFVKDDGLQSNQFNHASACRTSDGMMMFGGINGITTFYPENITDTQINDSILFTDLLLNNKPVYPGDKTGILRQHIVKTDRFVLKNDQNVFTIRFSAINFNTNNHVNYQYRLKGERDTWTLISGNSLTFSDIAPGKYTFSVRVDPAMVTDGNPRVSSINIEVLPPWWQHPLMYVVYFISIAGILLFAYRIVKGRVRMHNELQIEKIEKQKMEEMQKMQMQFFMNISHEFKTPLTLILSPLEKLKTACVHDEWKSRQIELIYKNAISLRSLIDRLMSFRKAESGHVKLRVAKGEIIEVLSRIYSSFYTMARGKDINYTFNTDRKELVTFFDNYVLERVCYNLLSNAFKFTPAGGDISFNVKTSQEEIIISVKDSGKGIPKDQQQLIFERFYSVADNEMVGGTGIGLTYAKLLAEIHHGSIEVESEEGKGAEFSFRFPLSESAYSAAEITEIEGILKDQDVSFTPDIPDAPYVLSEHIHQDKLSSILVVDDNLNITSYLYDNLSLEYNVDVAHDGEEALRKVNERDYDMLICDVMMPKMNGILLCKKIKQNIKTCHIPVIMLTAKSDMEYQVEGLEVGADDYIAKPFSLNLLETKIRNIINTRRRLKELYKNSIDVVPDKIAYFHKDQEFLSKAAAFVEEHIAEPDFSVESLAELMCMSRSNLHLKFKAITGDSISEFIKKIRFRKAVELLESGKYNVTEVSMMTGFSTPSYFTKVFKKKFDCLPTEYKKRLQ